MALFDFLKKAADPASMITDAVMGVANGAADIVDRFVTNPAEKAAVEKELRDFQLEAQRLAMQQDTEYFTDRQSARKLGESDKWTPRILTIIFTVSFFGILAVVLYNIFESTWSEMSDMQQIILSSILGSVTTIMTQIVAYYFGASRGGDEQGQKMADNLKKPG